jgi:UDP-N-acetylglucosamine--N-acetylmuramyl-(pentapeptide) pyrophosphoryl-undecaprenol N-acetylglucosamine transferase
MVYLPDIEPGLAVRVIARLAARVAVTVEDSRSYFPAHKVVVTGYPVRAEFHNLDRAEARASLGLASGDPVLLVMGGSRGARSINRALSGVLEQMLKLAQVVHVSKLAQVVHVSGELDWPWVSERREALPMALKARYHAFPYLHEKMGSVLAAADLAVCRAGASTLGELPFFGLPAVGAISARLALPASQRRVAGRAGGGGVPGRRAIARRVVADSVSSAQRPGSVGGDGGPDAGAVVL